MFLEVLQKCVELAVQAEAPRVVKPPQEPDHVYLLVQGPSVNRLEAEPAPRQHAAGSLATIIQTAQRFGTEDGAPPVAVWYDRDGVTLVCDDRTRRDTVHLPLVLSDQVRQLQFWAAKRTSLSQRDLILTLRTTFKDSLSSHALIDVLRTVKLQASSQTTAVEKHGERSIGKSLEAQVSGTDAIPEYIYFTVPVFDGRVHRFLYAVDCALEPDPQTGTWQVIPLPNEVEDAIGQAEEAIGSQLREALVETPVAVYHGEP